jgi:hypothetical protein
MFPLMHNLMASCILFSAALTEGFFFFFLPLTLFRSHCVNLDRTFFIYFGNLYLMKKKQRTFPFCTKTQNILVRTVPLFTVHYLLFTIHRAPS